MHKIEWTEQPKNILLIAKLNTSSEETILKIGEFLSKTYPGTNLIIQNSPMLKEIFQNIPNVTYFSSKDDLSKVDLIIASGGTYYLLNFR